MVRQSLERSSGALQSAKKGSAVGLTVGFGVGTAVGVVIGLGVGLAIGTTVGIAFSAISRSKRKNAEEDGARQ